MARQQQQQQQHSTRSSGGNSFKMWLEQEATVSLATGLILGVLLTFLFRLLRTKEETEVKKDKKSSSSMMPTPQQTLHLIQNRRSIMPKVRIFFKKTILNSLCKLKHFEKFMK